MQGTSLDEVFGSFGTPVDFLNNGASMLFDLRQAPNIPTRDASGTTLYQIAQEQLLQGLSVEIPAIDTKVLQLRITIDDYKILKEQYKSLRAQLELIENNVKQVEDARLNASNAINNYTNTLCMDKFLSKEEFESLQEKQKDLHDLQQLFTDKCLSEYNKKIIELHASLRTVQTNMTAYSEFIKEGTKEMVGPDAKPNSCTICFENEINHCFVPCGHTFCEKCIKKSSTKKCMSCRTEIQKTIKIFLGV